MKNPVKNFPFLKRWTGIFQPEAGAMGGGTRKGPGRGKRLRAAGTADLFDAKYADAAIGLNFSNSLELLVATVLSAQCTDVRVNKVTPSLFAKYRSAADYAGADLNVFMEEVRSTGFFRNKAANIMAAARQISTRFDGRVPQTMEELVSLPGIGRKTANVILGNAFGISGIVVDTHVRRVSNRLGLTSNSDPVKIEFDLMGLFPEERWTRLSHQMIAHGRQLCKAPRPRCRDCFFDSSLCPARADFLQQQEDIQRIP